MAANDELPRGWVMQAAFNPGAANPTLTLTGVAGHFGSAYPDPPLSHVLTDISVTMACNAAVSFAPLPVNVNDFLLSALLFSLGWIVVNATNSVSAATWNGKYMAPQGHAVGVNINGTLPANVWADITVAGYCV